MDISLLTRTAIKIVTGNVRNPKRATANMDQISLADALPNAKTMMVTMNMVIMANTRDHMGVTVPLIATR